MTNQIFAAAAVPRLVPACMSMICRTMLALLLLACVTPSVGHAQSQTWIPSNPNNDWSVTAPNWDTGVPWTNGNNAIFGGTGETVEIASDVLVNDITFNSTGYTIADADAGSIFSLSSGSIITVPTAGHIATISESIAAGGITKGGAGILVLSGDNTFGGTVSVTAGILRLSSNTALGSPTASTLVSGTGIIELLNGVTITGETITVGSGGDNYGGLRAGVDATTIWAGSILLDSGSRLGALNGSLLDVTGIISNGTTGVLQISTTGSSTATLGTVRISAAATYTGNTNIVRGRLQLGIDGALPTTTVIDIDTATASEDSIFDLNGHTQTIAGLTRGGAGFGGGSFVLNSSATAATLTLQNAAQTYAGIVQDGTGVLNIVKSGTGTQTLAGDNTYTGTTTISGGTLALSGTNTLPGAVTVSGGTLSLTGGTHSLGAVSVTSGTLSSAASATATLASLSYASSSSSTLAGTITITGSTTVSAGSLIMSGSNTVGAVSVTTGGALTLGPSTIGGAINVNAATLTLSGANTFSSTVLVTGTNAVLNVNNNGSLGAAGGSAITVSLGGRLVLANGVTITGKNLVLSGGGNNNGALQTASGATATWAGNISTIAADTRIGGGDTGGNLIINGVISGAGGVLYSRANNSTTTLNGVATYTGDTQLFANGGTGARLVIGVDNALNGTSRLSVISSTAITVAATIDLNGHPIAFTAADTSAMHASGNFLFLQNNGAVGSTAALTFSGVGISAVAGSSQVFSGHINDGTSGTGGMSLVKSGAYVQTLVNTNSLTGATTVNFGTLQVGAASGTGYTGSNGTLGSASIILNGIGTIAAANTNTGTLAIDNLGATNNSPNRLSDSADLSFRGGTFLYRGSELASTNSTETIGTITAHSKRSLLTMTYGGSNTATLNATSFARSANGGLLFVNGANLGLNSLSTASVSRILLTTAPTLVGTTAAASTGVGTIKNLQIVPGMIGEATETTGGAGTATGTANTFLTYNATTGLRPLNPTDEFSSSFTAGDNVRLTAAATLASTMSINSLILVGTTGTTTTTIGSGKVLTVASGQILFTGVTGVTGSTLGNGGTLAFGNREGIITSFSPGNTTISSIITGTAGVSYYGTSQLVTNQQHTYSGATGLYIASTVPQSSSLGSPGAPTSGPFGTGTLILGGSSLRATTANAIVVHNNVDFRTDTAMATGAGNATSTFTFTGAVSLSNGTRTLSNAADANTYFTGVISGTTADAGLTVTGTSTKAIVLSGANTYTGATTVSSNTTLIINGSQTAATGAVNINAGTLGGSGTLGGATTIASGATLSPGDITAPTVAVPISVSMNGTLSGVSSLTLKSGSNTALQITTATFTSLDSFGGNAPGTAGYNSYVVTNGNTAGSAGTAHDKLIFTGITQEAGGKITVTGSSFTPVAGQIFNLLDWTDVTTLGGNLGTSPRDGSGDSALDLDLPDISASGYAWDVSLFATYGIIVVTPEPGRALLLGIGIAMLSLRRRRK